MLFIKRYRSLLHKRSSENLFEKVMQDSEHTNEMLVQMKAQQQIASQELQESFQVLLHMIHYSSTTLKHKRKLKREPLINLN